MKVVVQGVNRPHSARPKGHSLSMSSNECFVKVGNKKVDAPIHDPILDNSEAEKALAVPRALRMRQLNLTEEEIALLFG